jgi:hypothetical protein
MNVTGFTLYNSETNAALRSVEPGELLDFNLLENEFGTSDFTIVCETSGPVASTRLTDNYGSDVTDNDAPFSLAPGTGDDVGVTPFLDNIGGWTVSCQPFCEADGGGEAGTAATIEFRARNCITCNTECIRIVGKFN